MKYKQYVKPNIILPILSGIIIGSILFFFNELDNVPGLSPIGIVVSFCLVFFGVHNMSKINPKIKAKVIVPLFFGAAGIIAAIITVLILFLNGEFTDSPGVLLIGMALCMGLVFIGLFNIEKIRQRINPGIAVPLFYCIGGIILVLLAPFDGDVSSSQRIFVTGIIFFIGVISISINMLVSKLRLNRKRI
jgi:hypothetical protein